uniref:Fumarylacetoacetase-like C-terminal domain-containing protein n=1 Tax=Noctiluca scintillans TaxID=2966 RepID=A0A7S0ZY25_NOCSC|mmetsp:Transcript_23596/g.62178  ORF Transcript_23596/g.62178 Transcript_23596/m.62178 type:complete len:251 (+) Transcript_23596:51-803(+)
MAMASLRRLSRGTCYVNRHGQLSTRSVSFSSVLAQSPPAIYCIGLNYKRHAAEAGMDIPKFPIFFMKPPTAVVAHGDAIRIPAVCHPEEVDWEVELAVVIGKAAKNVSAKTALDHVLGYTVANDVSARRWQGKKGGGQWCRAKVFDTFCPLGPRLVPASEIPDPNQLALSCTVNGEVMQQSNTSDMIFSVAHIIEFLSEGTTLLPGTVILTGTPEGVGFARKPPLFLKPGDSVTVSIEGIGELTNPVFAE